MSKPIGLAVEYSHAMVVMDDGAMYWLDINCPERGWREAPPLPRTEAAGREKEGAC